MTAFKLDLRGLSDIFCKNLQSECGGSVIGPSKGAYFRFCGGQRPDHALLTPMSFVQAWTLYH